MSTMAMQVRERPILFSGAMIRAILDGRKTQTRRVVKPQPVANEPWKECPWRIEKGLARFNLTDKQLREGDLCPYGQPADRLWVREAVYIDQMPYDRGALPRGRPGDLDERSIYYRADGECCDQIPECSCAEVGKPRWRPSIHMPRWASRITLEITDVRVERVQEISEDDARAEGISTACDLEPRECFRDLWDGINGPRGYGWDANPWVWCLSFRPAAAPQGAEREG